MHDELLSVIKGILRTRDLTYRELAESAGIPLSTLKKTLAGSGDLTVRKLLDICGALDVTLEDVAASAARARKTPKTFAPSAEDQAFFVANLSHYVLYLAILRGVRTVDALAAHAGLGVRMLREYLDALEKRELIRQDSRGEYQVRGEGAFSLPASSALYKQSFSAEFLAFAKHVVDRVAVSPQKGKTHLENGSVLCSKETFERFKAALGAVVDEFLPAFLRDKKMHAAAALERYNFVLCVSQFDWTRGYFDQR